MADQIDDGGPAFPVPAYATETRNDYACHQGIDAGMTLRDWFAGQALAGIIAIAGGGEFADYAADAYGYADAMIAARKQGALHKGDAK